MMYAGTGGIATVAALWFVGALIATGDIGKAFTSAIPAFVLLLIALVALVLATARTGLGSRRRGQGQC